MQLSFVLIRGPGSPGGRPRRLPNGVRSRVSEMKYLRQVLLGRPETGPRLAATHGPRPTERRTDRIGARPAATLGRQGSGDGRVPRRHWGLRRHSGHGIPGAILRGIWSGRRDSNPRHPAWKARALPTELLPLATRDIAPDEWWRGEDSNLRRLRRQIYSLFPLTAREPLHVNQPLARSWAPGGATA
jgi:hypothetical protein